MGQDNSKQEREQKAWLDINTPYKCVETPHKQVYVLYQKYNDADGYIAFELMCIHKNYEKAYNCAKLNSKFNKYEDLNIKKAHPDMDENYIYYGSQKDFDYDDGYGYLIEGIDLKE